MKRRGCNLGCMVAGLGLILSCCLLPYLISSIYSIVTALLDVPGVPDWLWGDWIRTLVGDSDALYMVLAEGPICCVATVGLLIFILGMVAYISGMGGPEEPDTELTQEAYEEREPYEHYPESDEYGDYEAYDEYEDGETYDEYGDGETYDEYEDQGPYDDYGN
jgi:hypothetical protein